MTTVYDEVGRQSEYQNVELFIESKPNIRNVAIIKYSWHISLEKPYCAENTN